MSETNKVVVHSLGGKLLKGTIERKGLDSVVANIPLGRLTNEADMAGVAIYLASKAGAYLTAVEIPVDGGYTSA